MSQVSSTALKCLEQNQFDVAVLPLGVPEETVADPNRPLQTAVSYASVPPQASTCADTPTNRIQTNHWTTSFGIGDLTSVRWRRGKAHVYQLVVDRPVPDFAHQVAHLRTEVRWSMAAGLLT
ncbi:hypothetical protein SAMN05661093_10932 [Kibdelosporangium aridum]|uniref:Uncharacterized protein n=1 Tax=Kibdelosporangium aridum TaxID=2030 RepID=A0A1W2FZD7_KIBAR|nr:hypothetical protein SAMN05661093_10932 [Kibdelosporangium aridum]